jgi:uncharacterized protein (DUF885 family)
METKGPFMHPLFHVAAVSFAAVAAAAAAQPVQNQAEQRFKALYEREWRWRQEQTGGGEDEQRVRPSLPDVTPRAQQARLRYWEQVLAELGRIDRRTLSADSQLDYDVYLYQIETLAAQQRFRDWEKPLNSDSSFWGDLAYTRAGRCAAKRIIATTSRCCATCRAISASRRRTCARPRPRLHAAQDHARGRDASLASVAQAARPEDTVWYEPFRNMAGAVPGRAAGGASRPGGGGDPHRRHPRPCRNASLYARRIYAARQDRARRDDASRRPGLLPVEDSRVHDAS